METIKVNMTPCEDVQTIHASQNDNEAREWGFELHNNGDKIDSSSISDQLVFKAYEGGTEQILPENTSTPTTSPFIGDIKYPQGLLSDQEFLYRESPTEEDGLAKITDIKGNTLVWNQLIQNGNFADGTNHWTAASGGTISVVDGVLTYEVTEVGASTTSNRFYNQLPLYVDHTYLCIGEFSSTKANVRVTARRTTTSNLFFQIDMPNANTWYKASGIATMNANGSNLTITYNNASSIGAVGDKIYARNIMLIDLTLLGQEFTADQFASLFPLPYYAYNQGTLLSFNGNSIRAVSKNQFDTQVVTTSYAGLVLTKTQGTIRAVYSGGSQYAGFNFYGSPVFTDTFLKGKYRLSFDVKGLDTQWTVGLRQGASFLGGGQALAISNDGHHSFTIDAEANPNCYLSFARTGNKTTAYDVTFSNIQLELGTTETSYTPFEEQTISLPISQYFPWGMDGVGTAYDELTNSGYAKKLARVTFDGTKSIESIVTIGSYTRFTIAHGLSNVKYPNAQQRSNYLPYVVSFSEESSHFYMNGSTVIIIMPTSLIGSTRETANAYLQSNPLTIAYELATPLENYGIVDLGSMNWTYSSANSVFLGEIVGKTYSAGSPSNVLCPLYTTKNVSSGNGAYPNDDMIVWKVTNGAVRVKNSAYTNPTVFKQAMQGVYLLYEKENPQGFTTATLVTENGEVALANENGVLVGRCNSDISADAGFIEGKIKLSDEDGDVYSSKIQIHVERSPQ